MTETNAFSKFAEMMLHKDSEFIPKILKSIVTDEQADLLVSLPGTASQMAEKMNRDETAVDADLKRMFRMGLTFKKEKDGDTIWRAPAHLIQFHDATLVWPEATDKFINLWQQYMEKEWPHLAPQLTQFIPRPFTRVLPVNKSIDAGKAQVLAPDNVKELIKSADRIAVTKCTCRLTMKKCDAPVEVCLQINRGADYTLDRGSGRELTKDEALEVIEKAQEAGLVHVTMNKTDAGHFICNCCGCCCQAFTLLISDGVNLCDPSRYKPEIDAELCSACGTCEERCWFDTIKVGDNDIAEVDAEKCLGCGQCAIGCPEEAITMVEVRTPDFIPG
ncbi:MAG: 4Fe-4S binding protein [Deltaproteobacteria bacterium]|nr:4Fe-4S binding protein [Deltaproteobacteria bacterium]